MFTKIYKILMYLRSLFSKLRKHKYSAIIIGNETWALDNNLAIAIKK